MQENLASENKKCNLVANKYFGRLLRALDQSKNVIVDKKLDQQLLSTTNGLSDLRKRRSTIGNLSIDCTSELNLYESLKKILGI